MSKWDPVSNPTGDAEGRLAEIRESWERRRNLGARVTTYITTADAEWLLAECDRLARALEEAQRERDELRGRA